MIANPLAASRWWMSTESDKDFIMRLVAYVGAAPSEVAKRAGLAVSTITRPLNHPVNYKLSKATIDRLREAFPDFPDWAPAADLPEIDPHSTYVDVAVIPSYAGAGGGGSGEGDRMVAKLPRRLIEDELRGKASDFELIDVRGDSMSPDFQNGDQILIDKRDRNPRQPGPFVLWDEDGYVVKLVERVPQRRGWYRVFSANSRYSAYEIEEAQTTILGRPVWFARRL